MSTAPTYATATQSQKRRLTREKNARLIAAAPDLLAALKELSAHVEELKWGQTYAGRPHAIADAARAAIAKAEGGR